MYTLGVPTYVICSGDVCLVVLLCWGKHVLKCNALNNMYMYTPWYIYIQHGRCAAWGVPSYTIWPQQSVPYWCSRVTDRATLCSATSACAHMPCALRTCLIVFASLELLRFETPNTGPGHELRPKSAVWNIVTMFSTFRPRQHELIRLRTTGWESETLVWPWQLNLMIDKEMVHHCPTALASCREFLFDLCYHAWHILLVVLWQLSCIKSQWTRLRLPRSWVWSLYVQHSQEPCASWATSSCLVKLKELIVTES